MAVFIRNALRVTSMHVYVHTVTSCEISLGSPFMSGNIYTRCHNN